ncbi:MULTISPECIES: metallophosphoesterase [unclassified Oceanispirochaeta]|uniref:metallophosphoesterase family protein n=1 Tax=unclassified Oceanispirochaeta TaxID=2635722 RepID=UPI000E097D3E|nr:MULTISPECIES: metallophosphoesterase [unclassified Oceanispirochaeta]MBF9015010.1 metallophosphoesterase [Oceanispirochaeta sp. M2]NPD71309.1 hypothetical protein [Oceanispirochaeta sp. M1]RDG33275.1 hypothetical protein DV872_04270 [Oceanispirochaeta sp. M1]
MKKNHILNIIIVSFLFIGCSPAEKITSPFTVPEGNILTSFSVTADMREYTSNDINYFRGVCERLSFGGAGDFMISPGDIDPPDQAYSALQDYLGENYIWYPVVGNHEAETVSDMNWLREHNPNGDSLPGIVHLGPDNGVETTYSFDYGNLHIIVLNEYYDGTSDIATDGDITDPLYDWLVNDLTTYSKSVTLVIGHEPAFPLADEESGRIRHVGDSLDKYPVNRDRFWTLLRDNDVMAYICGHTHNYSKTKVDSVWQIDAGHARGIADTGSRSTFLMFYLMDDTSLWCYTYRLNYSSSQYELTDFEQL